METNSEVLTEEEVAERLKISTETLRNWRRDGVGPPPAEMPGRLVRYSWRRVMEWIEREASGESAAAPAAPKTAKRSSARTARTGAPEQLSDEQWSKLAAWVAEKEPWALQRLPELVDACLGHFRASGKPMADWQLVARNWVRNERTRYGRGGGGNLNGHARKIGPLEAAVRNIAARRGIGGAAANDLQVVLDLSPPPRR